jgi:predicted TIM-barrel fold metal-dependent hydrolase
MSREDESAGRRDFLMASGAALALIGLPPRATPAAAAEKTAAVASDRIDCQSHLFAPELVTLMERRATDPVVYTKDGERYVRMGPWHRKILPKHSDVAAKLADMDSHGIRLTALSINDPGPEWFGDDGPRIARVANDYIAGVVAGHPDRFFGLCVLPIQDVPASLAELDRCVKTLGMKGLLLYTNGAGRFPDEPEFRPIFARAVDLDIPVLLHPALPVTASLVQGYEMISGLGNMFDNTIALARIIMSGLLDQFPKLRLVCPHLGGTLPYIVGRIDHQTQVLKRGPKYLTKAPSAYLKQVYLDIVSPLPLAMRFGHDFMGSDRLLFASDHPWVDPGLIIDGLRSLALPAEDERKIFAGNAARLFKLDEPRTGATRP